MFVVRRCGSLFAWFVGVSLFVVCGWLIVCCFCALCGRSSMFVGFICGSSALFVGRCWLLRVLWFAVLGVRDCWLFRVRSCLLIVVG